MYELNQAVKIASSSIAKGTIEILRYFKLAGDGENLTITANNLSTMIEIKTQYKGSKIDCCVDAPRFAAAVSQMDNPNLSASSGKLAVKSGKMKATIPILPSDQYPTVPKTQHITAIPGDLLQIIKPIMFASAQNDVRHYLNGVFVSIKNGTLTAVATNGHRISVIRDKHDGSLENDAILPIESLNAIKSIKTSCFSISNAVSLNDDGLKIVMQPIDGKYPDFMGVIKKPDITILIDVAPLLDTLKAMHNIIDKAQLWMEWDQSLAMSMIKDETSLVNNIDCDINECGKFSCNSKYLMDVIETISSERVTLGFAEDFSQMIIEDGVTTHIICPLI